MGFIFILLTTNVHSFIIIINTYHKSWIHRYLYLSFTLFQAQQNGEMTFDMKKVVGKIMEAMFVYVNDEHLEHEAWSNDAEFTEMVRFTIRTG